MKKALAAFGLAVMASTLGVSFASPAQATVPKHTVTILDACMETSVVVANAWEEKAITVRAAGGDAVTIDGNGEHTFNVAQTEPFKVEVKAWGDKWATLAEHTWTRPAACEPYTKPTWDCDRWALNLVNPKSLNAANARWTLKLEPMQENVKLLWTLKPGDNESLNLGKDVTARVKIGKGKWADYKWQTPEGGCQGMSPAPSTPEPSATATPAAGAGSELPVTGAGTKTFAGVGVGMVGVGGLGLWWAMRRRKRLNFAA